MPRKPRMHLPGGFYHVIARGNNKEIIFNDHSDYSSYVSLLDKYGPLKNTVLHAYVLMPNHVHLILQPNTLPLSKLMQVVQQTYTQGFNKRYNHVGHVFQGRYKAFLVDEEAYLLALIRYIHLNPVRAKICSLPEQYPWSSHHHYITGQGPGRVETEFVTSILAGYGSKSISDYQLLPEDALTGNANLPPVQPTGDIGDEQATIDADLDTILHIVADTTAVPAEEITGPRQPPQISRARCLFSYSASILANHPAVRVAEYLGRTPSSVSVANRKVSAELRRENTELTTTVNSIRVRLEKLKS